MKKFTKLLIVIIGLLTISSQAMAFSTTSTVCSSGNSTASSSASVCQDQGQSSDPIAGSGGILSKVINIIILIVGVVSVFMIVIGGLEYVTSGGDSNRINTAKNTILFALIGLVVVALAGSMLYFVAGNI